MEPHGVVLTTWGVRGRAGSVGWAGVGTNHGCHTSVRSPVGAPARSRNLPSSLVGAPSSVSSSNLDEGLRGFGDVEGGAQAFSDTVDGGEGAEDEGEGRLGANGIPHTVGMADW